MVNRRGFISLLACAAAAPRITWAQARPGKVALYASVGAEFTQYDVNVDGTELVKRGSVTLPAGVQYAWPHVSSQYLYVASSNGGVGLAGAAGDSRLRRAGGPFTGCYSVIRNRGVTAHSLS